MPDLYYSNRSIGTFVAISCKGPRMFNTLSNPFLQSFMLLLGQIIQKHNLSFYRYVDDTQIYLRLEPNKYNKLTDLNNSLQDM